MVNFSLIKLMWGFVCLRLFLCDMIRRTSCCVKLVFVFNIRSFCYYVLLFINVCIVFNLFNNMWNFFLFIFIFKCLLFIVFNVNCIFKLFFGVRFSLSSSLFLNVIFYFKFFSLFICIVVLSVVCCNLFLFFLYDLYIVLVCFFGNLSCSSFRFSVVSSTSKCVVFVIVYFNVVIIVFVFLGVMVLLIILWNLE